jgi:hypothetical protein
MADRGRFPARHCSIRGIHAESNSIPDLTLLGEVIARIAWRAWRKALAIKFPLMGERPARPAAGMTISTSDAC